MRPTLSYKTKACLKSAQGSSKSAGALSVREFGQNQPKSPNWSSPIAGPYFLGPSPRRGRYTCYCAGLEARQDFLILFVVKYVGVSKRMRFLCSPSLRKDVVPLCVCVCESSCRRPPHSSDECAKATIWKHDVAFPIVRASARQHGAHGSGFYLVRCPGAVRWGCGISAHLPLALRFVGAMGRTHIMASSWPAVGLFVPRGRTANAGCFSSLPVRVSIVAAAYEMQALLATPPTPKPNGASPGGGPKS